MRARLLAFPGCEGLPRNPRQQRRRLTPSDALVPKLERLRDERPVSFMVIEAMIDNLIEKCDQAKAGA